MDSEMLVVMGWAQELSCLEMQPKVGGCLLHHRPLGEAKLKEFDCLSHQVRP